MQKDGVHVFRCRFEDNTFYISKISILCKNSVMVAAADRRHLTPKVRCRSQTDLYVVFIKKIALEMFLPDSFGFLYSSFINRLHYTTQFLTEV